MDSLGEGVQPRRSGRPGGRSDPHRLAVALLVVAFAVPLSAAQLVEDVRDIATAPLRWRTHEWTRLGEGVALVLAVRAVDHELIDAVQRNHHHLADEYFHHITPMGGGRGDQLAVVLAAGGWLAHDERLMHSGIDAFEASTFANGITGAGKRLFRRPRPSGSDNRSFPSGHATTAFALATALSARYDDKAWVAPLAYTIASSVAVARVYENHHFPADVVAGGLIGRAMAKSIAHQHVALTVTRHALLVTVKR